MIAAIYSRKSKFTGKGESIENQIQLCMDYGKNLGIKDFLIYEDEGFSGKTTDRPKFKEMLKDAKNKKFDYLICYRLDRISRNVSDFSTLIEDLNKLDISFISIKEQFDTSTPMGRAMMYISSVFAQLERETIAERVRDNMYELARTGRWLGGKTPHGFVSKQISYFDENMRERNMYQLSVDENEMETIKLVFDKYLELRSLSKLYKYVYSNGIKGPRGGNFDPSSLSIILRSPAYVKANDEVLNYLRNNNMEVIGTPNSSFGILTYAKNTTTPIAAVAKHDGVINADKWLEAQSLLNINKDKAPRVGTGKKTLLSGLLKCSKCNSNMRVNYKHSNTGTIIYYVCGTKKTLGVSICNCKNIRADKLESIIVDKIRNQNTDSIINAYNEIKNENTKDNDDLIKDLKKLKDKIKDKETLIDTLIMQLARLTDISTSELIINKLEIMNKELAVLKQELESLEDISNTLNKTEIDIDILIDNINKFQSEIGSADLERQKFLLSTIIENIIWYDENETAVINYLGIKKKV